MKFQRVLCIAVLIANLVEAQLHTQRSLKKKAAPMGAEKAAPKKVEAKKGLEKKGEDGNLIRKNRYMAETAKKSVLIKDEAASISAVAKEMAASKETAAKEKAALKESAVPKEKAAAETKKVGDTKKADTKKDETKKADTKKVETKKFETKKVETKGKVGDLRKNRYI